MELLTSNFCKYPWPFAGKIIVFPTHHCLNELIRTAVLELTFCIPGIFFPYKCTYSPIRDVWYLSHSGAKVFGLSRTAATSFNSAVVCPDLKFARQNKTGTVVPITVRWMSLARSSHKTTVSRNQWEGQRYLEYLVCCNLKLWNVVSFFGLIGPLYWRTSFHPEAYFTVMDHVLCG